MANRLPAIKHIVQLMLENRSFDQVLGFLYTANGNKSPTNQPFEGLTGNETNPDDAGRPIKVYKIDRNAPHPYLMPGADPGEGFQNTNYQLFCTDDPAPGAVPTNQGFVINFKAAIQSDQAVGFRTYDTPTTHSVSRNPICVASARRYSPAAWGETPEARSAQ